VTEQDPIENREVDQQEKPKKSGGVLSTLLLIIWYSFLVLAGLAVLAVAAIFIICSL
jgi:flagellar basal body-associated protein FliL